ncbi:hypothetical protein Y032_0472g2066 [Ancylostoma ceylanicum]|nr:hypothetical protein Y032_0472g2066 [Ancylostoma ceylanicum]
MKQMRKISAATQITAQVSPRGNPWRCAYESSPIIPGRGWSGTRDGRGEMCILLLEIRRTATSTQICGDRSHPRGLILTMYDLVVLENFAPNLKKKEPILPAGTRSRLSLSFMQYNIGL